jgi:hypothetical protein
MVEMREGRLWRRKPLPSPHTQDPRLCTCMYVRKYVYTHTQIDTVCACACVCVCVIMYMYLCLHTYVYACMHACIHTYRDYTHTHTHTLIYNIVPAIMLPEEEEEEFPS